MHDGSALPTDYTFTGQKNDATTGLMFYSARYYDTTLARFTQPDTIVPSPFNPQSLNRYAYTLNNPVRYSDPTGHMEEEEDGGGGDGQDDNTASERADETVTTVGGGAVVILPVYTGDNQYTNGKACWPRCNEGIKQANPNYTCGMQSGVQSCNDKEGRKEASWANQRTAGDCTVWGIGCEPTPKWHPSFTFSAGIEGFAEAGAGIQGDIGLFNLDGKGTMQLLSASGGARETTGMGAGWDVYVQGTNAKSVDDIAAYSANTGITGPPGSVDFVYGKSHSYQGFRLGVGENPSWTFPIIPGDLHSGGSYTFLSPIRVDLLK